MLRKFLAISTLLCLFGRLTVSLPVIVSDSGEDNSEEEYSGSGGDSGESHESGESSESKGYSVQSNKVQSETGFGSIDGTMMYFLGGDGQGDLSGADKVQEKHIPCNNMKNQYFVESDRCNGIYQCDGNGEDERNCPSKCHGLRYPNIVNPKDCSAFFPRFYFDFETRECKDFAYGGCAKVDNMFLSKIECERECLGETLDFQFKSPQVRLLSEIEEDNGELVPEQATSQSQDAASGDKPFTILALNVDA